MQIQLKQTEIVAALKQYVSNQGISLAGKTVDISFTAGRKEAGIVADISIEDVSIPGFTDSVEQKAPELKVVGTVPTAVQAAAVVQEPEQAPEPEVAVAEKTTSLFS